MRALILPRVTPIETGAGGPMLIGDATAPEMVPLTRFLTRNGQSHQVVDSVAGPEDAALAHATCERLSVIVLDARAFGGQAGASARIENYRGLPTGITSQGLSGRAFEQTEKFGAEIVVPA